MDARCQTTKETSGDGLRWGRWEPKWRSIREGDKSHNWVVPSTTLMRIGEGRKMERERQYVRTG